MPSILCNLYTFHYPHVGLITANQALVLLYSNWGQWSLGLTVSEVFSVFIVLKNTVVTCDCGMVECGLLLPTLGWRDQCQLLYHNWCCVWSSWWIAEWPAACCTGDTQLVCLLVCLFEVLKKNWILLGWYFHWSFQILNRQRESTGDNFPSVSSLRTHICTCIYI